MKRFGAWMLCLTLAAALLSGCGRASSNGLLSDFTAATIDGDAVDSSIFSDYDLTLVNVWGTFCPNCLPEMTDLSALADEYADQKVQILGIVGDIRYTDGDHEAEKIQRAKDLIEQTGAANYTHILPSDSLAKAILDDMQGFPTTFFVDSEGNQVGTTFLLARDRQFWADTIEARLKEVRK